MTNDLRKVTDDDRRILLNKEIIAINQDALGKAAERIVNKNLKHLELKPLKFEAIAAKFEEGSKVFDQEVASAIMSSEYYDR